MKLMHRLSIAIIIAGCLSMLGCNYFAESNFELAHDSRLPKWFMQPSGLSRSEVTVTMSYYISPSGRTAVFTLLDTKGHKISELNGIVKGIEPVRLKDQQSHLVPDYPLYEIVTVNGITEIIEHRQSEPIFYITDDSSVIAEVERLANER
jgi:hypothetical protein